MQHSILLDDDGRRVLVSNGFGGDAVLDGPPHARFKAENEAVRGS